MIVRNAKELLSFQKHVTSIANNIPDMKSDQARPYVKGTVEAREKRVGARRSAGRAIGHSAA